MTDASLEEVIRQSFFTGYKTAAAHAEWMLELPELALMTGAEALAMFAETARQTSITQSQLNPANDKGVK